MAAASVMSMRLLCLLALAATAIAWEPRSTDAAAKGKQRPTADAGSIPGLEARPEVPDMSGAMRTIEGHVDILPDFYDNDPRFSDLVVVVETKTRRIWELVWDNSKAGWGIERPSDVFSGYTIQATGVPDADGSKLFVTAVAVVGKGGSRHLLLEEEGEGVEAEAEPIDVGPDASGAEHNDGPAALLRAVGGRKLSQTMSMQVVVTRPPTSSATGTIAGLDCTRLRSSMWQVMSATHRAALRPANSQSAIVCGKPTGWYSNSGGVVVTVTFATATGLANWSRAFVATTVQSFHRNGGVPCGLALTARLSTSGSRPKMYLCSPPNVASNITYVRTATLCCAGSSTASPPPTVTPPRSTAGLPVSADYDMSSIAYVLDICNWVHPNSPEEIKTKYFGLGSTRAYPNLKDMIETVSYGNWRFSANSNVVFPVKVKIPCSGRTPAGNAYDFSKCGHNEIYALVELAEAKAESMGVDISKYKHRIMMLWGTDHCPWGGLGSTGCVNNVDDGPCYVWHNQMHFPDVGLKTLVHELGHNLGHNHAGRPGNEYGDQSCLMGAHYGVKYFNAPHTWVSGWSEPIANGDMSATSHTPGRWHSFSIPALATSSKNFVRLNPAVTGTASTYFVSYRIFTGYDAQFQKDYNNTLTVHQFDGQYALSRRPVPLDLGIVAPGARWNGPDVKGVRTGAPKFRVLFSSVNTASKVATVKVCWWKDSTQMAACS